MLKLKSKEIRNNPKMEELVIKKTELNNTITEKDKKIMTLVNEKVEMKKRIEALETQLAL
jgi:phage shock protein A